MKIDYPPDRQLKAEDYAKALNARNTPLSTLFENLNAVYYKIIDETSELEIPGIPPGVARDHHPILALYAHEFAHRLGAYLNIPHDNSTAFCKQRLYMLTEGRDMFTTHDGDMFIDRAGRLFWSKDKRTHLRVISFPISTEKIEAIESEYGGVVTNFSKEDGQLYV